MPTITCYFARLRPVKCEDGWQIRCMREQPITCSGDCGPTCLGYRPQNSSREGKCAGRNKAVSRVSSNDGSNVSTPGSNVSPVSNVSNVSTLSAFSAVRRKGGCCGKKS